MRDDDLFEVEVGDFYFRGKEVNLIRVALNHINFDRDNNQRSNFTIEEVVLLVIDELNGQFFEPQGKKDDVLYFVHIILIGEKPYKLVFEMKEGTLVITVITLFRQRLKKRLK